MIERSKRFSMGHSLPGQHIIGKFSKLFRWLFSECIVHKNSFLIV